MRKTRVYLDQNVVSKIACNPDLPVLDEQCLFVYSNVHFSEIARSDEPNKYLDALERIDAKYIELFLDDEFRFTDQAILHLDGTPLEHYEKHLRNRSVNNINDGIFNPFIAWVNGGKDVKSLSELPNEIINEFNSIIADTTQEKQAELNSIVYDFKKNIDDMINHGNNIIHIRSELGNVKGKISNISGSNVIKKIWDILKEHNSNRTCDEFFGFDPILKQGYEKWPLILSIISCCSVMDIIGYQSEQKCRKLQQIPNIMDDASHIAMASFCDFIVSIDKRLVKRAEAIYEYKNIPTKTVLL